MFEKIEIIIIILSLLMTFYLVIYFGARKKQGIQSEEIKRYLRGVRALIIILAIVSVILWLFL